MFGASLDEEVDNRAQRKPPIDFVALRERLTQSNSAIGSGRKTGRSSGRRNLKTRCGGGEDSVDLWCALAQNRVMSNLDCFTYLSPLLSNMQDFMLFRAIVEKLHGKDTKTCPIIVPEKWQLSGDASEVKKETKEHLKMMFDSEPSPHILLKGLKEVCDDDHTDELLLYEAFKLVAKIACENFTDAAARNELEEKDQSRRKPVDRRRFMNDYGGPERLRAGAGSGGEQLRD